MPPFYRMGGAGDTAAENAAGVLHWYPKLRVHGEFDRPFRVVRRPPVVGSGGPCRCRAVGVEGDWRSVRNT